MQPKPIYFVRHGKKRTTSTLAYKKAYTTLRRNCFASTGFVAILGTGWMAVYGITVCVWWSNSTISLLFNVSANLANFIWSEHGAFTPSSYSVQWACFQGEPKSMVARAKASFCSPSGTDFSLSSISMQRFLLPDHKCNNRRSVNQNFLLNYDMWWIRRNRIRCQFFLWICDSMQDEPQRRQSVPLLVTVGEIAACT